MVVLIDAKYFGSMLRNARRHHGIKSNDVAKMLKTTVKDLHKYEQGCAPIPESILLSLFYNGFCLLHCKRIRPK